MNFLYYLFIIFFVSLIITRKWRLSAYLFIIFLPLGNIFQSNILFSGLSLINISALTFIIISLSNPNVKKNIRDLDQFQSLSINFIIFYFLIFNNIYICKFDLLVRDADTFRIILDILKNSLIGMAYILIIINSHYLIRSKILYRAISIGTFIVFLSMLFSYQLMALGFLVNTDMETISAFDKVNIRLSGFYDGDVNAAASFLIVVFGYFLSLYEKKKKPIVTFFLVVCFAGMLFTGSRGVALAIAAIFILFIINNSSKFSIKSFFGLIFISTVLYFIFYFQGTTITDRLFSDQSQEEIYIYNESFRFIRWKTLLQDMIANPSFFLFGNLHTPPIGPQNQVIISPHNEYVRVLYFGGILLFFYYIKLYYKIFKINRIIKKTNGLTIIYSFVGMIMTYMFLSNFVNQYFPIILILLGFNNYSQSNNKQTME